MSIECPFCRDVDQVCPFHGPVPVPVVPPRDSPAELAHRLELLELLYLDLSGRVGRMEDEVRRRREREEKSNEP